MSKAENLLAIHLTEKGFTYEAEAKLIDGRRFRWDFVVGKLAIEIQGGIWMKKGAHNTGKAIARDCEKARLAIMAGYIPVSFVTEEVMNGTAIKWLCEYVSK